MLTRKVDRKMRSYGDYDEKKKSIRVNPKMGGLLNTIIHEELHHSRPKLTEKQIGKKAKVIENKLTPKKAIRLLSKYTKKR